jgi:hypothetical protein
MNVGIGTAAAQFLSWEFLFLFSVLLSLQCVLLLARFFKERIPIGWVRG